MLNWRLENETARFIIPECKADRDRGDNDSTEGRSQSTITSSMHARLIKICLLSAVLSLQCLHSDPGIHQLKSFQSICMTKSPRPDSTQQCQKLISGMKHVARLLPAAGCCCVFILWLYADETRELARLSAVEQEEKNFYFESIRKAGKCCEEEKNVKTFCCLFVCLFGFQE